MVGKLTWFEVIQYCLFNVSLEGIDSYISVNIKAIL
jgi:hypothetical protein